MPESRREHYRVKYPFAERPIFEVGRASYEVVECSERGIRYEVPDHGVPELGDEIGGNIHFKRGATVEIVGEVTRAHSGLVVLLLQVQGIPFSEILFEQRYLRSKGYKLIE